VLRKAKKRLRKGKTLGGKSKDKNWKILHGKLGNKQKGLEKRFGRNLKKTTTTIDRNVGGGGGVLGKNLLRFNSGKKRGEGFKGG